MSVDVQIAADDAQVPSSDCLARWAQAALNEGRGDCDLTIRVVGHEEGSSLNEQFRRGSGATNVLSFVFEPPPDVDLDVDLLGDVVICAPVVAREACAQSKPLAAHYAHMVVHGVLHLQGHDHVELTQAKIMERRECDVLIDLGFSDPYADEHDEAVL